jgi:hypothetical protein
MKRMSWFENRKKRKEASSRARGSGCRVEQLEVWEFGLFRAVLAGLPEGKNSAPR